MSSPENSCNVKMKLNHDDLAWNLSNKTIESLQIEKKYVFMFAVHKGIVLLD
jgi:hypothetical protein